MSPKTKQAANKHKTTKRYEKPSPLRSPWYSNSKKPGERGMTLFEQLDATEVPPRDPLAPFRMPVIDR